MNWRNRLRRLEKIAPAFHVRCKKCGDNPSRIFAVDPETDVMWQESLPESGCPECGTPIRSEIMLVIPDDGRPIVHGI